MSGVESHRGDALLDPVDHNLQVGLREWPVGLKAVGTTVSCAGNEVQLILVFKRGCAFVKGRIWVHDQVNGFVVAD